LRALEGKHTRCLSNAPMLVPVTPQLVCALATLDSMALHANAQPARTTAMDMVLPVKP